MLKVVQSTPEFTATRSAQMQRYQENKARTINPLAVYELHSVFENIKNEFLAKAQLRDIALTLVFNESIGVAYWDIASLRHRVFGVILPSVLQATPQGGQVQIAVEKIGDYAVTITILSPVNLANNFAENFKDAQLCIAEHGGEISFVSQATQAATLVIGLRLYHLCLM